MDTLPGVPLTSRLDEINDGLGVWERKFPLPLSVKMGINIAIDALSQLTAVDDCTSDLRILLFNSVSRTAIDLERKVFLVERTNQGAELKLLVDVRLHILLE